VVFLVEARTRDVSSTEVRTRLRAGLPIDDLVPPPVARHILAHQLYGAVDHLHGEKQRSNR
jgi:nicotinic acid mononucleotide adenylyltransferase